LQGDYIWIEPVTGREFDVAIGARVVSAEGRRIQVKDDDTKEQWLTPERRIKAMHATSVQGVEDMISLGDLHEAGILRNLLIRYNENLIYVSCLFMMVFSNDRTRTQGFQIIPPSRRYRYICNLKSKIKNVFIFLEFAFWLEITKRSH